MSIYKLSFILVLAYVILLGRPVYEEISLEPGWSADMVSGSSGSFPVDSADFIPFKFSGHFGYYLPSGKIPYNDEILYDTAIDEKGFINFSSINKNLILRSPDGSVTGMVEAVGYPFFSATRRFIISNDETSLTEVDVNGNILWSYNFGSLITDISASGSFVAAGTLNSGLKVLDNGGNEVFGYKPDYSRVNVIYGTAVSGDDNSILLISGIDPQMVILFSRKNSGYRIVYSKKLDEELRYQRRCGFSDDGLYAYFDNSSSISILDIKRKIIRSIPMDGILRAVVFEGDDELVYTASEIEGRVEFSGFLPKGIRIFSFQLNGDAPYLWKDRSGIYVGLDNNLMKLNLERR